MKRVILETEPWERGAFEGLNTGHEIVFVDEPLTPDNTDRHAASGIISSCIYSDLSSKSLAQREYRHEQGGCKCKIMPGVPSNISDRMGE